MAAAAPASVEAEGRRQARRRYGLGALLLAALAGILLALVFTVGKRQGAAKAASSSPSSVHDGHAAAAGDVTATVTPIVEAGGPAKDAAATHDHAAAAGTSTAASTATTTTKPAAGTAGAQAPTSAASILADALANNPLLSNLGDPLQINKQTHVHTTTTTDGSASGSGGSSSAGDMGDMDMGDMDMGDMDMGDEGGDTASEIKAYLGEQTCLVADIDELQDAVENGVCPLVVLTSAEKDAYMLMDMNEIIVSRRVRVMGHPAILPKIDAMMGMRAFTITAGGYLELQYVRVAASMGMYRDRYGLEGRDGMGTKVLETRGGSVLVEQGAEGASFLGVIFLMVNTAPDMVNSAIQDTINLTGWRVYGGQVYVAAGTVRFLNCHFWTSMVLMPFTDVVIIGNDVLVVAGNVFFTGCTFTSTMLFCNYASAGYNVATLGGNTILTWCTFQWQSIAMSMEVAGMVLFTGGGVTVLTGVDFRYVGAVMNFMGLGSFMTGAGVMIMTGVTQEQAYAVFSSFGGGMYNAVGSGVLVETGATYVQYSGPGYMAMTGMATFVGSGSSTHVGVPASMYGSTGTQHGQGGFSYNGAGVSVWVGCPLAMFWATFAFFGLGGVTSHNAGLIVWVGNPVFMAMAVSYFAGLGMIMFVGAGSAVIAGSPVAMPSALMAFSSPTMTVMTDDVMNPTSAMAGMDHMAGGGMMMPNGTMDMDHMMMMPMAANFWVQGNTEATGKGGAFATGYGLIQTNLRWASHMLDSDPDVNLWEYNNTMMAMRRGRERRRLLSAQTLMDTAALFGNDALGAPKLLAVGLDANSDVDLRRPEVYDQYKAWVPASMLESAKDMAAIREAMSGSSSSSSSGGGSGSRAGLDDPVTLHVENAHLDFCGICETSDVDGAGLEVCDVEASCDDLQAAAPAGAQAAFGFDELAFDPYTLVIADFRPTTAQGETVDPKAFQRALQGYLHASGITGVQVTAFSALPDPFFAEKDGLDASHLASGLANEEYPLTHPIRAVFVTPDAGKAADLAAALEDPGSNGYANMDLYVGDVLNTDEGVVIQTIDGRLAQQIRVPAYKSADFTSAFADQLDAAAGANAVRLVDPDNSAIPLARAVTGQEYAVQLRGFQPNSFLNVQLIGSAKDAATGVSRQTVLAVKPILTTGKDGAASFTWRVPAGQQLGEYYLKATDLKGRSFGLSPSFDIDSQRRRRLVGPSHELFY